MNLSHDFPELNNGQIKMLERYIHEREQAAIASHVGKPNKKTS